MSQKERLPRSNGEPWDDRDLDADVAEKVFGLPVLRDWPVHWSDHRDEYLCAPIQKDGTPDLEFQAPYGQYEDREHAYIVEPARPKPEDEYRQAYLVPHYSSRYDSYYHDLIDHIHNQGWEMKVETQVHPHRDALFRVTFVKPLTRTDDEVFWATDTSFPRAICKVAVHLAETGRIKP